MPALRRAIEQVPGVFWDASKTAKLVVLKLVNAAAKKHGDD